MRTSERLQTLVKAIAECPHADFYREIWEGAKSFESLPAVSREDFFRFPLSRRRYKEKKGVAKVVHSNKRAFLSEWSFEDIAKEDLGDLNSHRPLIYFKDTHEVLEKCIWSYEKGALPFAREKDLGLTVTAAAKYHVDGLVVDPQGLLELSSHLSSLPGLETITIVGETFEEKSIQVGKKYVNNVRYILARPEVGAYAEMLRGKDLLFKGLPDTFLEGEKELIVTKKRELVTPVIRYNTRLSVHWIDRRAGIFGFAG